MKCRYLWHNLRQETKFFICNVRRHIHVWQTTATYRSIWVDLCVHDTINNTTNKLTIYISTFMVIWLVYTAVVYLDLTCVLESGRSQGTVPLRLSSAILALSLWARTTVSGMNSSVSSVAYPNIRPCPHRRPTNQLRCHQSLSRIHSGCEVLYLSTILRYLYFISVFPFYATWHFYSTIIQREILFFEQL